MFKQAPFKGSNPSAGSGQAPSAGSGRDGQSLIEILIGIAIGAIIIGGAAVTIGLTLRSNVSTKNVQVATAFAQELIDQLTVFTDANWHNLYGLNKSEQYYLASSIGVLSSVSGQESGANLLLDGVQFSRYFVAENVMRDSNGNIILSGGTDDPSTQKVTVTVTWLEGGSNGQVSLNKYLTRGRNLIFHQTDWSGGGGQDTFPAPSATNNRYHTGSGLLINSPVGSIKKAP